MRLLDYASNARSENNTIAKIPPHLFIEFLGLTSIEEMAGVWNFFNFPWRNFRGQFRDNLFAEKTIPVCIFGEQLFEEILDATTTHFQDTDKALMIPMIWSIVQKHCTGETLRALTTAKEVWFEKQSI